MSAILAIFRAAPLWAWVLGCALGFGAVQTLRLDDAQDELVAEKANAQATIERTRATYAAEAASAASAALAETDRRLNAQRIATDEAESKAAQARSDALAADVASGRLRQRFAALAATCSRPASDHPAVISERPAAEPPSDLLAELFRRVDERAGELAAYADAARIAGSACVQSYDALGR